MQVFVEDCNGRFQFLSFCDQNVAKALVCLDLEEGKNLGLEKVQRLQGLDLRARLGQNLLTGWRSLLGVLQIFDRLRHLIHDEFLLQASQATNQG